MFGRYGLKFFLGRDSCDGFVVDKIERGLEGPMSLRLPASAARGEHTTLQAKHTGGRNMDDAELQAIRAARLQEMQRNAQGGGGSGSGVSGSGDDARDKANSVNEGILTQSLDQSAKERLNRVRMVKPERVLGVENYLVRLVQSGGLRAKVTEADIVDILDKIAQEERKNTTTRIKFERRDYVDANAGASRRSEDDSEDDFFDE